MDSAVFSLFYGSTGAPRVCGDLTSSVYIREFLSPPTSPHLPVEGGFQLSGGRCSLGGTRSEGGGPGTPQRQAAPSGIPDGAACFRENSARG